ncbi:MAG: hypothetical protein EOO01_00940 [Chitinophagaceae bacterium]|nr:MAG: hypothetical protein EOO01_00940 [Chitinophagaceae bacterium]
MKIFEVPQDESSLSKGNMKELIYAIDHNGDYTTAQSSGWTPKTIALSNAIAEIEDRVAETKLRVVKGEVSPIAYFMELHRMDLNILSEYVGMWQWRVRRHFKPAVFAGMNDRILQKYATAFDITIAELKYFKA